jgi:hypothetical protein
MKEKIKYKNAKEMWEDLREPEKEHLFWRDRNPPNCLNCGKVEKVLIEYINPYLANKE